MSEQDDKVFVKHFSGIIAALVVFTIVIALLANYIHGQMAPSENPSRQARIEDRIKPVSAVYAGEEGRAAIAQAEAAAAASRPAAFDGSLDGEMLYTNVCAACHTSGAAGAPRLEAAAWTDRLAKGEETLLENAINGIGLMPAKGGRSDLSDEQLAASVTYMLEQVQQ